MVGVVSNLQHVAFVGVDEGGGELQRKLWTNFFRKKFSQAISSPFFPEQIWAILVPS